MHASKFSTQEERSPVPQRMLWNAKHMRTDELPSGVIRYQRCLLFSFTHSLYLTSLDTHIRFVVSKSGALSIKTMCTVRQGAEGIHVLHKSPSSATCVSESIQQNWDKVQFGIFILLTKCENFQ